MNPITGSIQNSAGGQTAIRYFAVFCFCEIQYLQDKFLFLLFFLYLPILFLTRSCMQLDCIRNDVPARNLWYTSTIQFFLSYFFKEINHPQSNGITVLNISMKK